MTDAIDIYRAVKLVIDNHREDAVLYAKARTAALREDPAPSSSGGEIG